MSTKSQSRTEEVAASHIKKAQNPRLRTLQSRMVKRPLRVQTDLSEAGSVKSDPNPQNSTQVELRRCATQKSRMGASKLPSSPQEIEEGSIPPHHLSPLKGSKRTASERQRGPESAGNMKRECKSIATECLQSLYEIVLALSDSRSRHKYNLEAERTKHAQELVRIERPTTKI
ncbi:hypothetical protein EVAR_50150_1 [Eumeta japonica]|uniref:Uncharacterized protein n=1 Tax=Eumeta variegata TaxID=151549 RepID=A0A4C1SI43_EUMVA|nr:hypothetical protein EVAR_50150_1 [Eumeta japonica]